jgi:GTP pyrophosphokinase
MLPAITRPVKCPPNHRLISPQPAAVNPLSRRAQEAAAELRVPTRCRIPLSLSLSRAVVPPCQSAPPATARRARAAVAAGGDKGSSSALLAGAQSRHAIFRDELVRRALSVAEAAHRGQVLASTKSCLLKFRHSVVAFCFF